MRERSIANVPRAVLALLAAGLAVQLAMHVGASRQQKQTESLPPAPSSSVLRLLSFGEPVALARALTLYVQALDNPFPGQDGQHALNDPRLTEWLGRPLALDPAGQYPLLLASRVYAEVPDREAQRRMLDFVHRQFLADPNRRWPWLAHAAYLARHRLGDLPRALVYARAIREHATGDKVPNWARQMEIFLLEDMNELQAARILLGGLLDSGEITDPHELNFLRERLTGLEKKAAQP